MNRLFLYIVLIFLLLPCSSNSMADTLGIESLQLLRQQIRDEARKKQQEKIPDVQVEGLEALQVTGRLPEKESPCFIIHHFELKAASAATMSSEGFPDEHFPTENFQWALTAINPMDDPATGKCLGTTGVNLVIKRVQNAIIARGYVTTRVLAEPQQLAGGTLVLSVIPGVVNNIYFANEADDRANHWIVLPVQTGVLLNLRDIEQGLENFKRLPSVEADIKIAPATGAKVMCT